MRLIRFGQKGSEKPGLMVDGVRRDCSSIVKDYNHDFFQSGGLEALASAVEGIDLPIVPDAERWAAPIARPGKVVCIGLNYSDHALESKMPIPTEPIVFLKGTNTVVGPYDDVTIPRRSVKTDWEVELGVVIGKDASYLGSIEEAAGFIAGYCISHDVSEREFQLERGGQWTKGKSCDNFNPIGPWLSTKDEVSDVNDLSMQLWVNGQRMQNGNTDKMVFDVFYLVHYLSQFMTLEAGDLITTGTPPGVGLAMNPPRYLRAGDVVELEIAGLGRQRQVCVDA